MRAEQAKAMASYNRWMNERLYEICAGLTDEERKLDRNAFFHSIHGTLNHFLLGDIIWLGRFEGEPFRVDSLDQELYADFQELSKERRLTDRKIEDWASELTEEMLSDRFHFSSIVFPGPRSCDLWVAVVHFFNHQTHHRGQLTTLLSQIGRDYGVTDFMWLPGLVAENGG